MPPCRVLQSDSVANPVWQDPAFSLKHTRSRLSTAQHSAQQNVLGRASDQHAYRMHCMPGGRACLWPASGFHRCTTSDAENEILA